MRDVQNARKIRLDDNVLEAIVDWNYRTIREIIVVIAKHWPEGTLSHARLIWWPWNFTPPREIEIRFFIILAIWKFFDFLNLVGSTRYHFISLSLHQLITSSAYHFISLSLSKLPTTTNFFSSSANNFSRSLVPFSLYRPTW
jgi:hypothetical protein